MDGSALAAYPLDGFPDGLSPRCFILERGGLRVALSDYGATILAISLREPDGAWTDLLLGPPEPAGHAIRDPRPYFGATVGRYANRIAGARFRLEGREYPLPANDGSNHLHGGPDGWDARMWRATARAADGGGPSVRMELSSPDGDQGYPGRVEASAMFSLSGDRSLSVRWEAVSDAATPVCLTSHGYFNLRGSGGILDHELELAAGGYVPIRPDRIPLGTVEPVEGTAFDFRGGKRLGRDMEAAGGYDHCWVLDAPGGESPAARVVDPDSGRWMELYTDLPGLQLYTGEFLGGTPGKGGVVYGKREGFCLEPEFLPDSPNQARFPTCILEPGMRYDRFMRLRFGRLPAR